MHFSSIINSDILQATKILELFANYYQFRRKQFNLEMDKHHTMHKDHFSSKEYHAEGFPLDYRNSLVESKAVQESFVSECLQKIYNSGRLSGSRLLDFGSGTSVHRIASASRQFSDIILAEWSESNRKELGKWLRGEEDALDWTPLLEQCARAEGYRDLDAGVAEIEKRIRKAVKKVVFCNALSEDILPEDLGDFDVITSSYCLECCCQNIEEYKKALKKLMEYLKEGGALITVTALKPEKYTGDKTSHALYITESIITEALKETGFEISDSFIWNDRGEYQAHGYGGIAVFYSVKT